MHALGDRGHIIDGTGDVGYVRQGDQAGARAQQLIQQRYIEFGGVRIDRPLDDADAGRGQAAPRA